MIIAKLLAMACHLRSTISEAPRRDSYVVNVYISFRHWPNPKRMVMWIACFYQHLIVTKVKMAMKKVYTKPPLLPVKFKDGSDFFEAGNVSFV